MDRRAFPGRSAVAAGVATVTCGSLVGLLARARGPRTTAPADAVRPTPTPGYGPLVDMGDLWLPDGFRHVAFGQAGTPLALSRGGAPVGTVPRGHDGMASFAAGGRLVRLVRNHENRTEASPLGGAGYDPNRHGGTITTEFDTTDPADRARDAARFRGQWTSLRGTSTNCAGGPTPWGSWLSCEETVETVVGVPHGYVFEVPAGADGPVDPLPLEAMGRFVHEAVALDPETGVAYQTEVADPLHAAAHEGLVLAAASADDGMQRAIGLETGGLDALHELRLRLRRELRGGESSLSVVQPWLWSQQTSGGKAMTDAGLRTGYELRLSRSRS
jgi:secreted PhoX family phosphatase